MEAYFSRIVVCSSMVDESDNLSMDGRDAACAPEVVLAERSDQGESTSDVALDDLEVDEIDDQGHCNSQNIFPVGCFVWPLVRLIKKDVYCP